MTRSHDDSIYIFGAGSLGRLVSRSLAASFDQSTIFPNGCLQIRNAQLNVLVLKIFWQKLLFSHLNVRWSISCTGNHSRAAKTLSFTRTLDSTVVYESLGCSFDCLFDLIDSAVTCSKAPGNESAQVTFLACKDDFARFMVCKPLLEMKALLYGKPFP